MLAIPVTNLLATAHNFARTVVDVCAAWRTKSTIQMTAYLRATFNFNFLFETSSNMYFNFTRKTKFTKSITAEKIDATTPLKLATRPFKIPNPVDKADRNGLRV